MPEYIAKAWYKDAATWLLLVTTATGILSDPTFGTIIPPLYLSKVMTIMGALGTLIRTISTARPVGWSDGSRSVEVSHIAKKDEPLREPLPPLPRGGWPTPPVEPLPPLPPVGGRGKENVEPLPPLPPVGGKDADRKR